MQWTVMDQTVEKKVKWLSYIIVLSGCVGSPAHGTLFRSQRPADGTQGWLCNLDLLSHRQPWAHRALVKKGVFVGLSYIL